ncbi:MAG: class I SAM-dependent methyltransferase [Anaerolineales bacterium]|nr:class I SAM-dependent methyltransferase [Anaerolineales bacterium]
MHRHADTFLTLEALGTRIPVYQPTYEFPGPYLDAAHAALAQGPFKDGFLIQRRDSRWLGQIIPGWLRAEDALKLYELAYFAAGDILELGSYHGLSTSIMAEAGRNSPQPKRLYSVDLDGMAVRAARFHLWRAGLAAAVQVERQEALAAVRAHAAAGRSLALVFVDHSHEYQPVYEVCRALPEVLPPGGFCVFHDFNDPRNRDSANRDYGVYQAVVAGLDPAHFEFWGCYGVLALYRRRGA